MSGLRRKRSQRKEPLRDLKGRSLKRAQREDRHRLTVRLQCYRNKAAAWRQVANTLGEVARGVCLGGTALFTILLVVLGTIDHQGFGVLALVLFLILSWIVTMLATVLVVVCLDYSTALSERQW